MNNNNELIVTISTNEFLLFINTITYIFLETQLKPSKISNDELISS